MGFKLGAIVGFGAGYYFGAKAGRERYEQLNRWAEKARQTDTYGAASARVRDLADEGVARAKEMATGSPTADAPDRAGAVNGAEVGDPAPDGP